MSAPASPAWIDFGVIARAHGVHGEVRVAPIHGGSELPEAVERVRVTPPGGGARTLTLRSVRPTTGALLVAFDEIEDRDAAQALAGARFAIEASAVPPLEPGELYLYELVGAEAVDEAGVVLGAVEGMLDNRGQDVLVLRGPAGDERLLPFLDDTLVRFDRGERRVVLRVPAGLWD